MSGLGQEIGEAYDDLIEAQADFRRVEELLKQVRSGEEVTLPMSVSTRDELIESLIGDRLDALEKIAQAMAPLVLFPFVDPSKGEDEEQDAPAEMVAALMGAVELVLSRPLTPGQCNFGYRLTWEDPPDPVVPAVTEFTPEPTFEEALSALLEQHGVVMGQLHLRDGKIVRNTLRAS